MAAAPSVKTCNCEEWMRAACASLPIYERHKGRDYCVLHLPEKKSQVHFEQAVENKLTSQDYNFSGVWFPSDANFAGYHFKEDTIFADCVFDDVSFYKSIFDGKVNFSNAHFKSQLNFSGVRVGSLANFSESTFEQFVDFSATEFAFGAEFRNCTFNGPSSFFSTEFSGSTDFFAVRFLEWAEFNGSEFKDSVSFVAATFSKPAHFTNTTFDGIVSFNSAVFAESARFGTTYAGREVFGDTAKLSLEDAIIDNPSRFSFHNMSLKPGWFFNVDCRQFEFTNVSWRNMGTDENYLPFRQAHELLRITYRQLAVNAEENHRYGEASDFRYLAMDVHRFERTKPGEFQWHKVAFWELTWWYWLASGYGERVVRAFLGILGIWLLFALIFTQVGFAANDKNAPNDSERTQPNYEAWGRPLGFSRALTYSAAVMTLQKPEPKPQTNTAQAAVLAATVLGPFQAALLALAIRRKFIR